MTSAFDPALPYHGGDLTWAERRFGRPAGGWVDLSTGINPWPYPVTPVAAEAWTRLPDAGALGRLLAIAAERYGAPGPESVAAAPGTQALIRLLPRLWSPRRVAVTGPTYGEHAASWRDAGHAVVEHDDPAKAAEDADIVVVTNPNNPDGRRFDPGTLDRIADRLAGGGGMLVVDEAFADLAPDRSLAPTVPEPGRIVLRSFGKFYGLAGLRLGFALADATTTAAIRLALGAWPVSGAAIAIGAEALADTQWAEATRRRLAAAAAGLREILTDAGLQIVGGTDLFALTERTDASSVFDRLGAAGVFVRHFPERPDRLRFGLPADERAVDRLAQALKAR